MVYCALTIGTQFDRYGSLSRKAADLRNLKINQETVPFPKQSVDWGCIALTRSEGLENLQLYRRNCPTIANCSTTIITTWYKDTEM